MCQSELTEFFAELTEFAGEENSVSSLLRNSTLETFSPLSTKSAHRHSLAILTADEGIAGNSAAKLTFTRFHRRKNRGSVAIFFAEEIAHLGASNSRAIFRNRQNRRRNRRESRDFDPLSSVALTSLPLKVQHRTRIFELEARCHVLL